MKQTPPTEAPKTEATATNQQAKPEEAKDQRKTPGVQRKRTRPFLAGIIIAKHGREAGVTDAMAAELDEKYGKPNKVESQFCLRNAWHAIRDYLDGEQ